MSKVNKDENAANDAIEDYFMKSNRPYSVNDIHNNLQQSCGFGKALVTRVMETMACTGPLKEKSWNKTKIYFLDQTKLPTISEEDMADINTQTEKLTAVYTELLENIKQCEQTLSGYKKQMSVAQIKKEISDVKTEVSVLETKLAAIKERSKNVDPEENIVVKKEREKLVGEWRKRKRMATKMLDQILEGASMSKKALIEKIGVETDEEAGVKFPSQ